MTLGGAFAARRRPLPRRSAMEITTRDYKRANVIRVTGRIDASTYAELEAKLA